MADKLKAGIELDDSSIKKEFGKVERQAKKTGKTVGKSFSSAFSKLSSPLTGLRTQILGIGTALAGAFAIKGVVQAGVNIEKLRTKFQVLLKSTEAANKQLAALRNFAASTPFELNGLATASAGLIAFGFQAEQTIPLLKQIGNAAAGSGRDLQEIALIYGQVAAAGKLTGERLLQLQERGINVAPVLAKNLGVAGTEIKKMVSEGKISLKDFQQAFQDLTTGSGLFAGAIEKQSKTIGGLLSTMSDNFEEVKIAIFETFGDEIKTGVDKFTSVLKGLAFVIKNNKEQIRSFIIDGIDFLKKKFRETVTAIKEFSNELKSLAIIGTIILVVGKLITVFSALKNLFAGFKVASLASKFTLLLNPVTAVLAAIVGVGLAVKKLNDIQKAADLNRPIEEQIAKTKESIDLLKESIRLKRIEAESGDGFLSRASAEDDVSNFQEALAPLTMKLADLQLARKKALSGDETDNAAIVDETKSLADQLAEIYNTVFNFKDPVTGEAKDAASIFKVTPEASATIKEGWTDIFGFLQIGFDNTAKTMKKTGDKIAAQFKAGLVSGITGGVQTIVSSIMNGENAFKNFGVLILQVIGDMATKMGATLIAAGIGIEALKSLGGAAAIAAGIGLVALGQVIKSFVGGGGGGADTSSAGGGAIGGAGVQDDDITSVADEEERQSPTTIVANINGPILDKRESGLAIVDILQEVFDEEGVTVRQGAFS